MCDKNLQDHSIPDKGHLCIPYPVHCHEFNTYLVFADQMKFDKNNFEIYAKFTTVWLSGIARVHST